MADDAARGIKLSRVPDAVRTMDDAYALAVEEPRRQREALEFVSRHVAVDKRDVKLKERSNLVAERAMLAYAAATLLACGKAQVALPLANMVLSQLNEQGRLYSTVDSVAAIALMIQLKKSGVVGGSGTLVVNGQRLPVARAAERSDQVEEIEVEDGVCMIEVTRLKEVRWAEGKAKAPLRVGFRDPRGRSVTRFAQGDRVDLLVTLPKGYQDGDLVHVCLPPSMAWIESGARVKRFTRDLCGRPELSIPVVVTHAITGAQRFAVAVRNMFEEERVASTGLVTIDAA
jgi:hypothetical protein